MYLLASWNQKNLFISKAKQNRKLILVYILLVIYLFVFLAQYVLKSGLIYDDVFNANIGGYKYFGLSSIDITVHFAKESLYTGRFYPLAYYAYCFFDLLNIRDSCLLYKEFLLVSTLINCLLIYQSVIIFSRQREIAVLSLVLFPIFCTMSCSYFSPIYGFHMLTQTVLSLTLISIILLKKYTENDSYKYKVFSLLAFAGALCTYELAFIFIIAHVLVLIMYMHDKTKRQKVIGQYICLWGLGIGANVIVRMMNKTVYDGATIHVEPKAVVDAFFKQISGSFPVIRYFGERDYYLMPETLMAVLREMVMTEWGVCILFGVILLLIYKIRENADVYIFEELDIIFIIVWGLLLTLGPAGIISLSQKYQTQVDWGKGYQPFYISSFGFSILFGVIIYHLLWARKRKIFWGILFGIIFLASEYNLVLNQTIGRYSIKWYDGYSKSRCLIVQAIEAGLLDNITSEDILVGCSNVQFDNYESSAFYSHLSKRKVQACSILEFEDVGGHKGCRQGLIDINEYINAYAIFHTYKDNRGIVCLAPLKEILGENEVICEGPIYIYLNCEKNDLEKVLLYKDDELKETVSKENIILGNDSIDNTILKISMGKSYNIYDFGVVQ